MIEVNVDGSWQQIGLNGVPPGFWSSMGTDGGAPSDTSASRSAEDGRRFSYIIIPCVTSARSSIIIPYVTSVRSSITSPWVLTPRRSCRVGLEMNRLAKIFAWGVIIAQVPIEFPSTRVCVYKC